MPSVEQGAEAGHATRGGRAPCKLLAVTDSQPPVVVGSIEENIRLAVAVEISDPDRVPPVEEVAEAGHATGWRRAPRELLPVADSQPPVAVGRVEEDIRFAV